MIPIRDRNPTEGSAYVTIGILAINVLAFLFWQPITGTAREQAIFFYCHGVVPLEVSQLQPLPEVVQACNGKSVIASVFTSMFLHGGWLHIGGNMLYLWVFGNNVEDRMGSVTFLLFYLGAGVAAALAQIGADAQSTIPMIGASGAIAGCLGAYLVMFPRHKVLTLVPIFFFLHLMELPAVLVLGFWFVLQALQGIGALGGDPRGVAWFAHIGG
ncbi:MAG: rhomboid family intramembrane serine protease, partial [Actinomycetota bacterium]|nr:rhomboid family intramembrane serine protease [Actinomycetota bacterium]